jgi:hypothetical protein
MADTSTSIEKISILIHITKQHHDISCLHATGRQNFHLPPLFSRPQPAVVFPQVTVIALK